MEVKEELDLLGLPAFMEKHADELSGLWHEYSIAYWGSLQGRVWKSGLTRKWMAVIETRTIPHTGTTVETMIESLEGSDTKEEAIRKCNEWYIKYLAAGGTKHDSD